MASTVKRSSSGSRAINSLHTLTASCKWKRNKNGSLTEMAVRFPQFQTHYRQQSSLACGTMFDWKRFASVQLVQYIALVHERNEMMINSGRRRFRLSFGRNVLMATGKRRIGFKNFAALLRRQFTTFVQVTFDNALGQFNTEYCWETQICLAFIWDARVA